MSRGVRLAVLLGIIAITAAVVDRVRGSCLLPLSLASLLTVVFWLSHCWIFERLSGRSYWAAVEMD